MLQDRQASKPAAMRHALSSARLQRCLYGNVCESRKLSERLEAMEALRVRAAESADRARQEVRRELLVIRVSTGRLEGSCRPGPEPDSEAALDGSGEFSKQHQRRHQHHHNRIVQRRLKRSLDVTPAATETLPPTPSASTSAGHVEVQQSTTEGQKSGFAGLGDTWRGGAGGVGGEATMALRSLLAARRSGVSSAGVGVTVGGDPRSVAAATGAALSTARRRRMLKALLPSSPSVLETRRAHSADLARRARARALGFLDPFESGRGGDPTPAELPLTK